MNIKVSYKLITTLWASKFPTRRYYHYWWAWSSILKVLKVTSLQYLKKEVRDGVQSFYNQRFYKLGLLFLMEVTRHVQRSQNRKLVIFLYLKKKVSQLLLCSVVMQIIQILYGGPVMFVVTCSFKWFLFIFA